MNVSADPRMIKQLLMAQWINDASPLDSEIAGQSGGVFDLILGDLMGSSPAELALSGQTGASGASLPLNVFSLPGSSASPFPAGLPFGQEKMSDEGAGSAAAYDGLIAAAASRYGLDPALIKGVIQTESGFQPDAVSPAGAKGLMQLMDDTARGLGVQNVWDPAQNIDGGTRFLSYLLRKYDGNVTSALAAYNAGPGRVDRLGLTDDRSVRERLNELPEETQRYIGKVLAAARQWGMQI